MRESKKMIFFIFVVTFILSCEKSEVFMFDESIHKGSVRASTGEILNFPASFVTTPREQSGLYELNAESYSNHLFNKPPLDIEIRITNIMEGCKTLEFAPAIPIGGAIDYPHAITLIKDGDQILGRYMLREDMESWVCIDEVLRDGRELVGTFELHMYRNAASFPWLETDWPDSLSLTEGTFRAFGRVRQ